MVCERVKFSLDRITGVSGSQLILLPWVPGVYQEVELKATGGLLPFPFYVLCLLNLVAVTTSNLDIIKCVGCATTFSDYKWFSSDMATVSVSASGVVQAKKPGKAIIKVVSIFDSLNHDEVAIFGILIVCVSLCMLVGKSNILLTV